MHPAVGGRIRCGGLVRGRRVSHPPQAIANTIVEMNIGALRASPSHITNALDTSTIQPKSRHVVVFRCLQLPDRIRELDGASPRASIHYRERHDPPATRRLAHPPRPRRRRRAPAKAEPRASKPAVGRAGGYELITELASGGMATVFLGRSLTADAPLVAVKRPHKHLASDKVFLSMLIDEARLCSAIHHENVVKVHELGFEGGEPFVVMDYVEGASLSELRKELAAAERAVDTKVAVKVILDALAGLHAAHTLRDENGRHLGIIHRDISPHNVLLGVDGKSRLTDFGIAHAVDRVQVTRTHEVKGKLAYLAPERIDKRRMCTVQSDVFSMAVVLWECLAGRRLFRGDEAIDTLQEVMNSHIPRLRLLGAQVPPALDDAIMRGLSRDLNARYATAEQFARAIAHAAGRGNIGTDADVAHVVETVFGPRLGMRHEHVRAVVSDETANHLFAQSETSSRVLRRRPTK